MSINSSYAPPPQFNNPTDIADWIRKQAGLDTIAIGCFCNPSQREFVGVIVDAGSADKQALARALGQYYSGEGVFAMVPIKQGFTCKGRPKGESWCTSSCTCDVQIKTP